MEYANEHELKEELERVLREFYYDDDFVYGTIKRARTPENWSVMLDFVDMAKKKGDVLTQDDLIALSIVLKKRLNGRDNQAVDNQSNQHVENLGPCKPKLKESKDDLERLLSEYSN